MLLLNHVRCAAGDEGQPRAQIIRCLCLRARRAALLFVLALQLTGCGIASLEATIIDPDAEQGPTPAVPLSMTAPVSLGGYVTPTARPNPSIEMGGIRFTFASPLAAGVSIDSSAAIEAPVDSLLARPASTRFLFEDYLLPDTAQPARIEVYPVEAYSDASLAAAQIILDLRRMLIERPRQPASPYPMLPIPEASQLFQSHLGYMDFQNGSGIRYITQLARNSAPITSADLFYTFQGITADGDYLVSAVFPVWNDTLLPDSDAVPGDTWEALVFDFAAYRDGIVRTMESHPETAFTPDLSMLDAVVESLAVQPDRE